MFSSKNNLTLNLFVLGLAGALLPIAFAPMSLWPLSFICLFILFKNWLTSTPKHAFWQGFIFGLGFFGVGVSWIFISIHRFGYTAIPLAVFITSLFVAFLSLFPALNGYLVKYIHCKANNHTKSAIRNFVASEKYLLLFVMPASYVLFEFLRSWILTGFPWLFIGYSQIDSPLAGFAQVIGVYGISFLTAMASSILILLFNKNNNKYTILSYIVLLASIWFGGQYLTNISWSKAKNTNHKISLIQGNITPDDKFLLEHPIETVWQKYGKPTFDLPNSELIVWPENSLPLPLPYSNSFIEQLDYFAKKSNQTLILGLPIKDDNDEQYYNSLLAVGKSTGRYDKQHLVPFGEYLPFDKLLRGAINFFDIPMSNFKSGKDFASQEQLKISLNGTSLLPLICYEIAYPQQVRNAMKHQPATVILTISEDGWFGDSFGPHQHLEIARMRALETGRYVIRSTTSGISAIIDNKGTIIARSPQFQEYVLTSEFVDFTGVTPWTRYGQWPLLIICLVILLCFILTCNIKK